MSDAAKPVISAQDGLACIRRELALRKNVYPKWVSNKRMKADDAEHEIAALQRIHDLFVSALSRETTRLAATTLQGELLHHYGACDMTDEKALAIVRSIRNAIFSGTILQGGTPEPPPPDHDNSRAAG